MLLQAMHSAVSQSIKTMGSGESTPNLNTNSNSNLDPTLLLSLLTQLATLTTSTDRLVETLLHTTSHSSQIHKLQDVHSASALAIALRKLNTSYAKRSSELIEAKSRVRVLEAEVEEAWAEAERLAGVLDRREEEERGRVEELEAALARALVEEQVNVEAQRAVAEEASRRDSKAEEVKRGSRVDIATLGGNRESRHGSQRVVSTISPVSPRNIPDTPRSPTPSSPASSVRSPSPTTRPVVVSNENDEAQPPPSKQHITHHPSFEDESQAGDSEDGEEEEEEEAVIVHAEILSVRTPLTPPPTMLRMKKSQPHLQNGFFGPETGDTVLIPEVVPWTTAPSLHAKARTLSEGSSNVKRLSGVGSPSSATPWRNSQIFIPPPNPEPSWPLPPVPPTPAEGSIVDPINGADVVPTPELQDSSIARPSTPPPQPSLKSPPTSPSRAQLRVIIPSSPPPAMLAPPRPHAPGSRPTSTYSRDSSAPGTPGGSRKAPPSSHSHSAGVVAARRRSRRTSQSSLRMPKSSISMGADAPPVPQVPSQYSVSAATPGGDTAGLLGGNRDEAGISDMFADIITPHLAGTLGQFASLPSAGGSGSGSGVVKRRTSMTGYPYADSIKQYKKRGNRLGDVSDEEEGAELGRTRTRDDIGVFVSCEFLL